MSRRDSRRHPRRWLRTTANSFAYAESKVLSIDFGFCRVDGRAGGAQYLVQRERADRLHAAGSDRLLLENTHERALSRQLRGAEVGQMRILVTGGAGFIGSHLFERLLGGGNEVLCLDKFFTGRRGK